MFNLNAEGLLEASGASELRYYLSDTLVTYGRVDFYLSNEQNQEVTKFEVRVALNQKENFPEESKFYAQAIEDKLLWYYLQVKQIDNDFPLFAILYCDLIKMETVS